MPQDGNQIYYESFNSFLAGALLTKHCINNFEFFNLMNSFENTYNVDIVSDQGDLFVSIYFDDSSIKLYNDLDDTVCVNGKKMTVRSYLYSSTSQRVREFFHMSNFNLKEDNKCNPFVKILSRKKREIA